MRKAKAARLELFGNAHAHVSSVDMHAGRRHSGENGYELVGGRRGEDDDAEFDSGRERGGLAGKAGIIIGIHNIFIVVPQFLVTGLSSIVFAIFDRKAIVPRPDNHPLINATVPANVELDDVRDTILRRGVELVELGARSAVDDERPGQSNSIIYIFRCVKSFLKLTQIADKSH